MKKLLTIIFSIVSFSALAAYQAGPMTTNKAAAYPSSGEFGVFNGTQWFFVNTNAFGSGAGATNLTPWTSDINGGGFSLTNAGTVAGTNFVGNGSGLTNIPGSALQSPLSVSSMNVGTLTATNTYLTNGYYFHTNATTSQWGYWDTNGVHFESNFLSSVWWWRGPTNSMSGVGATTNFQTDATSGNQTNSGTVKAGTFVGTAYATNSLGRALFTTNTDPNCLVFDAGVSAQWIATNASFTITGFSNTVAGYFSLISITMSNSAAAGTNITVTAPAGATAASNGSSTNALVINQGKQGVWSFWINPGHWTNYVNLVF